MTDEDYERNMEMIQMLGSLMRHNNNNVDRANQDARLNIMMTQLEQYRNGKYPLDFILISNPLDN